MSGATRFPVSGIGEEAFLITGETKNARGEPEHTAEGFVRVRNLTAYFVIGGDQEAAPGPARALLAAVAAEL